MTFDDKVIVSHPSPEDLQITMMRRQSIRWNIAKADLIEDTEMDKLVQGFTATSGITQIIPIKEH